MMLRIISKKLEGGDRTFGPVPNKKKMAGNYYFSKNYNP